MPPVEPTRTAAPIETVVRMRHRTGELPVLEGEGEVEHVTADDVRAELEAQRVEREERWR